MPRRAAAAGTQCVRQCHSRNAWFRVRVGSQGLPGKCPAPKELVFAASPRRAQSPRGHSRNAGHRVRVGALGPAGKESRLISTGFGTASPGQKQGHEHAACCEVPSLEHMCVSCMMRGNFGKRAGVSSAAGGRSQAQRATKAKKRAPMGACSFW